MWYLETKDHKIYPINSDDYYSGSSSNKISWRVTLKSWHKGTWISTPIKWVNEVCTNPTYKSIYHMFAFITLDKREIKFYNTLNIWEESD